MAIPRGATGCSSIVKRLEQNMEERSLPNILANYCCDLIDWACEQGLTKDEALQVMRDFSDRGDVVCGPRVPVRH